MIGKSVQIIWLFIVLSNSILILVSVCLTWLYESVICNDVNYNPQRSSIFCGKFHIICVFFFFFFFFIFLETKKEKKYISREISG